MKTRSIKRVAGAAAGAAVAASTLTALAAVPASAAGNSNVLVADFSGTLAVGSSAGGGNLGVNLYVHNGADASVAFVDSDSPIAVYGGPCVLGGSGDAARPYRATCSALNVGAVVSVGGTAKADNISVQVPGHYTVVTADGGNDVLHGASSQIDTLKGGQGADSIYVENGDTAGCGTNDAGTAPDGATDNVYYNTGSITYLNCNFTGGGTRDYATFSNKA